jgi:hypothetical protein
VSTLYVKLSLSFYSHRKTARLRSEIGDDAFWIPPRLWAYAAQNQPDGDMSGYPSHELAFLLGCEKHASSILEALLRAGFLDANGMIHGWEEHNGYHKTYSERAKKAAAARWSKEKPSSSKDEEKKRDKDIDIEASIASSMLEALKGRVGRWFSRRESTAWSEKELKALRAVLAMQTPEEDIALLEAHYTDPSSPFLRRDILTLLNNWNGEIDRAKQKTRHATTTPRSTSQRPSVADDRNRFIGTPGCEADSVDRPFL